jgi:hypothetical protein
LEAATGIETVYRALQFPGRISPVIDSCSELPVFSRMFPILISRCRLHSKLLAVFSASEGKPCERTYHVQGGSADGVIVGEVPDVESSRVSRRRLQSLGELAGISH